MKTEVSLVLHHPFEETDIQKHFFSFFHKREVGNRKSHQIFRKKEENTMQYCNFHCRLYIRENREKMGPLCGNIPHTNITHKDEDIFLEYLLIMKVI